MQIAIGADHGGYELKEQLLRWFVENGFLAVDVGCDSSQSVDYPLYAKKVVDELVSGRADRGVLVCGTGIGMCIAANRNRFIRAANPFDVNTAVLSRQHNDANVLCLGGRVLSLERAVAILDAWLTAEFSGGRHQRRVASLT
ncbi:MAG: ribose 5-phosphate isomerase B [Deltaproteobacteria bacterium]|nr:MAG: ribose 5-phosphate isomerase B [Deltaproteobacteria bacterium]PIE73168.1 MAG: ribose 5-phosphate isomerase B [Deltaproteobacteria bacterium]